MGETKKESHSNLVVVGASAGGIEALGILVGSLPDDFPAPVVLAQHLDPRRPSHLASILERRCKLQVVTVQETAPLEAGKVYVVPSNQHAVIEDDTIHLEGDHGDRPRPSVDLLLSSAAKSYGERLFAVVLTGSGSDGAAGAVEVKAAGGTVVIQNPATAAHPSMPLALPPTVVDHVEDIEKIGALLTDLLRAPPLGDNVVSDDAFGQILQRVGQHSAIDFRQYKPSTILRRIGRRMAIRHIPTLGEYRDYLETRPAEIAELVMSLLIKVTQFFRDREAYDILRRDVFPALVEGGRARGHVLRLWSAGCASGEEAYSLAFMAADVLGAELPDWNVKVFATDLDESAIAYARRAIYPSNTLLDLPATYSSRFFESFEGGMRVAKPIRQMVIFGQQDLSLGVPFPRIDLALCRNLLIYFKPELQQDLFDLFAYSLHHTRGFLFLGKAETVRPTKAAFELVNKKWKIYRCSSGPIHLPGRAAAPALTSVLEHRQRPDDASPEPVERDVNLTTVRRLNEILLRFIGVGVILVDTHYRILTINPVARRILGIREAGNDQDFLHTVRDLPYGEVRNAIDRVFRERAVVNLSEVPLDARSGHTRWVSLDFSPSHLEGANFDYALITVQDTTELVQFRQRVAMLETEQRQLSEDLGTSNQRLSELNKELQDANEELQASNEEMMLTQEELQATNEEFEATNEELQATNEELETNNEELQATNEELETTNDELVARTTELQELTHILGLERVRLADMVRLAPFHIALVTGPSMVVESVNLPSGAFIAGLVKGMSLEEAASAELQPLVTGIREVYQRGQSWTSPKVAIVSQENPGEPVTRLLEFTVIPQRDSKGHVMGVVVYGLDVTDVHGREEQARIEGYRMMIQHAHQVALALFDAKESTLLYASPAFSDLVSHQESENPVAAEARARREADGPHASLVGRLWADLGFLAPDEARAAFEAAVRERAPQRLSRISLSVGEGRETIWDCSLIPVLGPHAEEATHVVVSAVDVTDRVRERDQLQRTDRLKDEFLQLASHELRTPLTPLSVYAEVLNRLLVEPVRGPEWNRQMTKTVGKFQAQIAHLGRLTDDLFDVARLEGGRLSIERKPVDVKALLVRAHEQGDARVELQIPDLPKRVTVNGDEVRLLQVVSNLLSNASRHAPDARVELRLTIDDSSPTRKARITVKDAGPGITNEALGLLFTRFSAGTATLQTSRMGLGLGLFISRGIVEQHGGTIRAESKLGEGSSFIIELPLAD